MSNSDPVDVHRALQKAARELAFYADEGHHRAYFGAIDRLEEKLQAVRGLESGKPTVARLRRAAKQALELDEFLDACVAELSNDEMPLLTDFDLEYLSRKFDEVADRLSDD